MYLSFYNLRQEPFDVTPDPEFLYLSPQHREALAAIVYGIQHRKGFVSIIGEVGSGKTTLVRAYLQRVNRELIRPVYIFNPSLTFHELLLTIFRELGLKPPEAATFQLVRALHHLLISEFQKGRFIVLIVDEGQNMPAETLEKLRMLSNLETNKDKLLQIVLLGQPELDEILARHEMRQLAQRLAIRVTLKPLSEQESTEYIRHRLTRAAPGVVDNIVFEEKALNAIVREAKGIPRVINMLCDNALIAGFGRQARPVTRRIVRDVIADHGGGRRPNALRRWLFGDTCA